jgi:hypothetical protein
MRRLLSILLLAAFALPLVAPLLALAQDPDAGLPACCRRHGQHHCARLDAGHNNSAHRFVAVCPAWPQRAVPSPVGSHHFVSRASSAAVSLQISFSVTAQFCTPVVARQECLHPKRGPPPVISL